jgi:hypothetical protein
MVSTADTSSAAADEFEREVAAYFCRILGDVYEAICARRRTVSNGNRTASSSPDPMKAKRFHMEGFKTGSIDK